MARNKRSASPERLKKKRKVVLVKAQAAQGQAEKPKGLARAKPEPIRGGTAGRVLRGLLGARPEEKVPVEIKKATELRTASKPSAVKTSKKGSKCVAESDSDCSSDSRRSSSPSLSPSPIMAPVVLPAPAKRPKTASPKKESRVKKRAAPPALAPPAAKAKKANDGSSVKTKKTEAREAAVPVKVKKAEKPAKPAKPAKPLKPAKVAKSAAVQPELSELDQIGLQDAVLERLRTLCDKDVDPKVLAEYIVVLAQMNKGPEHLSNELGAFFSDKALLQSFVRWVEESKWSFVPGGQPPKPRSAASKGTSAQVDFWGPAPDTNGADSSRRMARASAEALAGPKTVRQGPHVAVTSRVVLQPNPNFDSPPKAQSAPITIGSPVRSPIAKAPQVPPLVRGRSAESQQVQLLGDFTKTLQTILTKLQNTDLDDSQRERYQAMADKIHSKIKTIKLAGSVRRR